MSRERAARAGGIVIAGWFSYGSFLGAMAEMIDFDWADAITGLVRLAIALLLSFPIAWERAQHERQLGLRTFPLVAVASCGYILVIQSIPGATAETQARVLQGLLAGIGFIGGGAIVKQGIDVRGLATAASIWNTGAVGAAVALQREEIAVVLSLVNFVILRVLTPLVPGEAGDEEQTRDESS